MIKNNKDENKNNEKIEENKNNEENKSMIHKKMKPMLDLIDELRENQVNNYIGLPSIVSKKK